MKTVELNLFKNKDVCQRMHFNIIIIINRSYTSHGTGTNNAPRGQTGLGTGQIGRLQTGRQTIVIQT